MESMIRFNDGPWAGTTVNSEEFGWPLPDKIMCVNGLEGIPETLIVAKYDSAFQGSKDLVIFQKVPGRESKLTDEQMEHLTFMIRGAEYEMVED